MPNSGFWAAFLRMVRLKILNSVKSLEKIHIWGCNKKSLLQNHIKTNLTNLSYQIDNHKKKNSDCSKIKYNLAF